MEWKTKPVIVGIGEVLWDIFPDGPRFGGAPANFACSAAALGAGATETFMVSSVGDDQLGDQAIEILKARHVHTKFLSQQPLPTGQVLVAIDAKGQATYEFTSDTAWDNIQWSHPLEVFANSVDAVCFGTLGQRSRVSQQTIQRFVQSTRNDSLRVFDINLRDPYWQVDLVRESLKIANVLKLNDGELLVLGRLLGLVGSEESQLHELMDRYAFRCVALTRGERGSLLLCSKSPSQSSRSARIASELPASPVKVIDTVGAGDAFTAALILGLIRGKELDSIHRWASSVAAFVCTQSGATPLLPKELLDLV